MYCETEVTIFYKKIILDLKKIVFISHFCNKRFGTSIVCFHFPMNIQHYIQVSALNLMSWQFYFSLKIKQEYIFLKTNNNWHVQYYVMMQVVSATRTSTNVPCRILATMAPPVGIWMAHTSATVLAVMLGFIAKIIQTTVHQVSFSP